MILLVLDILFVVLARTAAVDRWYALAEERPLFLWPAVGAFALTAYGHWWVGVRIAWRLTQAIRSAGGATTGTTAGTVLDPVAPERRRLHRFRAAAVCLSVMSTVGVLEVVFRLFDIRPPPAPRPQHLDARAVDNSRNALGLREEWDYLEDSDPRLRIAFLGDSFTYGESVEREQTFCHLVEGMVNDDWPDGVVTINVGQMGTSPSDQRFKYLDVREDICPDVVVHVIYLNDVGVNLHGFVRKIYGVLEDSTWFGSRSYVFRYAETQVRYWLAWNYTLDYFRGGGTPRERESAWGQFTQDVRACQRAAEEGGSFYGIVLFPWVYRLRDYPLRAWHSELHEFFEGLRVPYIDLLDVFEGLDDSLLRVSPVNEHPNPAGHRLAAERIARFLREEVFPRLPYRRQPRGL